MNTVANQAAAVVAGHAQDASMPEPLTLDQWRAVVAPWKPRMSTQVVVGQLRELIERCARAEAQQDQNARLLRERLRRIARLTR